MGRSITGMRQNQKIIVIGGTNASGKSDLAVLVARFINTNKKRFGVEGAEIISADSRQVYKGMDIGSGKITKKEMRGVPHHLLDVADPKRTFSVTRYRTLALREIKRIWRENRLPILCGGTGFYIDAVIHGTGIPEVKPNAKLRKKLEKKSIEELFRMLRKKDPMRARTIDGKNPVRLIRAIEIAEALGKVPKPSHTPLSADILFLGVKKEKEELKKRILIRLKKRMRQGMLREIARLHTRGVSWERMETLGLEYRYGARLLQKKITQSEFEETLVKEIMAYAKRQITWFKKEPGIVWITSKRETVERVEKFMKVQNSKVKMQK